MSRGLFCIFYWNGYYLVHQQHISCNHGGCFYTCKWHVLDSTWWMTCTEWHVLNLNRWITVYWNFNKFLYSINKEQILSVNGCFDMNKGHLPYLNGYSTEVLTAKCQ